MKRRGAIRMVSPATFEEHIEAWHDAGRDIEQGMWKRAAVAASFMESHSGDKAAVRAFSEKVDCKAAYFYRLAQVHRAFADPSTRVDHLSFTHHFEASGEEDPAAALHHAADEQLSARAFRAYLHPTKALVEHRREAAEAPAPVPAPEQSKPAETAPTDAEWDLKFEANRLRRAVARCPEDELKAFADAVQQELDRIVSRIGRRQP